MQQKNNGAHALSTNGVIDFNLFIVLIF